MFGAGLSRCLLGWFERHGRSLPWRERPQPYAVVVSEFMLQQTQVERVLPMFDAFVRAFPTFEALAAAQRSDVVRAWKGLGYNSRALRLHELARAVVSEHGGVLPSDLPRLRALPGIGPYTAAAVRAFAYNLNDIAVDTNVRRVAHRLRFGLEYPLARPAREVDAAAHALLVAGRAREVNAALMDLGATTCTARAPKCLVCPLRDYCAAAPINPQRLAALRGEARAKKPAAVGFEQSTRFARGRIIDVLRTLAPGAAISLLDLHGQLAYVPMARDQAALAAILERLAHEGLVRLQNNSVALAEA